MSVKEYWADVSDLEWFAERVRFETTGCWSWSGMKTVHGYGMFSRERGAKRRMAHRVAYELIVGPIPPARDLDHLCRNPGCVNPGHLEPVTHRENCLRGTGDPAVNARKTHCSRGHEFTPENTYFLKKRFGRHCRACARISDAKRRPRRAVA